MDSPALLVQRQEYVGQVILNRPKQKNALGPDFWPELRESFRELHDDPEVRAIVLCASGADFCAGLDLAACIKRFPRIEDGRLFDPAAARGLVMEMLEGFRAVEGCKKPVVAAVRGGCVGAGLDLAAACDIRLASGDAWFSLGEQKTGMVADLGVLQRLPVIIGEARTRELAFMPGRVSADRALEIGLVSAVHPDRDACLKAAEEMARAIALGGPIGVQAAKQVIGFCRGKSFPDSLDYLADRMSRVISSADFVEAYPSNGAEDD